MAGRMLSGSSGGNMGVWLRASQADYALIAQKAGHDRFTFEKMLPYFRGIETYWNKSADPKYHGFSGPIHTVAGRNYPLRDVIRKSYESMGYMCNPESMTGDPTGLTDLTQCFNATSESSCERQHSAGIYDLSNVHVLCESPVARILFDAEKNASGVTLLDSRQLAARKEVIISCGSQKPPQLLMLSGIGPASELSKHEIPTLVDSPSVGQNLFDHMVLTQYFKPRHPEKGLCLLFTGTEWIAFKNIPPSDLAPVLSADNEPGVKDNQHPHLQPKRCHIMTIPFYWPMLATSEYNPEIGPLDGTHMALTSLHLLPISRGAITLKSPNPFDNPVIDPRYFSTNTDRYILRRAVREILRLTETEPLASGLVGEAPPVDPRLPALSTKSSDEEIDARIRAFCGTIVHPMGPCALGTVLYAEFQVKGVQGLRVCDVSVFPEPVGAMLSQTIYAVGELCADLVAGRE
ncbi:GMC oxidoreductase [Zopfia rhizophila CBS 207.26]|uniref:GMC oxidoreductase n=1 Tax=Zopfia rhizophila CBS 207.26 TaxID=1314779 RepID=A0A6A6EUK4_9PEZI|nr:GMC oxidoreductase [Zopfia rhizophila CBS 207.26]